VDPTVPDTWEADVVLRDGHTVRMRSIRPDDAERIERFHERQSPESIYFRFFSPRPRLSEREIRHFTNVDHHDRVAFVALLDDELIGVARYERYEGTDTAEVAFFTDDRHHGRGLATLMLEYLAAAARENGITRFRATTLPANRKMLKVFAAAGYDVATHLEDGVVDVAFDLRATDEVFAAVDRRERQAEAASVRRLLRPESVAVIDVGGWSPDGDGHGTHGLAGAVALQLMGAGYTGVVTPVSPDRIDEMPEGTDLVVVSGAAASVPDVLDACGARGAGTAVVLSRASDDEALAMVEAARRRGLRLLGPGSYGVCNTDAEIRLHAMPTGPVPLPGAIGVLTESGDVVTSVVDHACRVGLGISTLVSSDVPVDVGVADLLSWWADDDATRAVLLHLGTGPLPGRFVRAARAASMAKPVAALRTAIRPAGSRRDVEQRRDEAMIRQSGVIPVANLQQLFAIGRLLADQPAPAGRGVAVVGASDGAVALAAAACSAAGLELAPLRHLTSSVDDHASALAAAAADPAVHSIIVVDTTPGPLPPAELASEILATSSARPDLTIVAATVGGERPARLVAPGSDVAVPVFTFPEHAANALGRLAAVGEWRSTARVYGEESPTGADADAARQLVATWRDGHDELELDHAQQAALLETFGLSITDRRTVVTADEAVDAARSIGWPVALKAQRRDRRKRTALSGVALDIADEDDLRNTWARMESALGADGMLPAVVQRFVEQGLDVAVRVQRTGSVVAVEVGLGGPAAAFDPWELGVLPLTLPDATVLVSSSSVGRALTDPIDRVPVVALVHRLAALADEVDEVHTIVADPVIVSGPTAWITDVAITVGEPQGDRPVRHLA
jgi:acyl-CoA synthetase (NDP forming)/RimJ/RimL family protein N-acetyltransferase